MIKKSKQAAGFIAVCILLFQTSCAVGGTARPLLWYGDQSFPFEMTLCAKDGEDEISLTGERSPASVTLTVTSPEGIRGLSVAYTNGNCTLSAGETVIPLSKTAASGLTRLLDGLLITSAEGAKIGSDEDGAPTVTTGDLTLTLDENGLPKSILDTKTGRTALLSVDGESITDTKNSNETNKDQQNNEIKDENNSRDLGIRADP